MTFQIGDKVIYPNHGLGVVETDRREDHPRHDLRLLPSAHPVERHDGARSGRQRRRRRLRRAITDDEVERLFGLLGDGKIDNHQNWKGRFKDNSDKMRTGSIYDVADVLKSLTFLTKSKSLSFREKRMLDRAKSLIVSEISEVMRDTPRPTSRSGSRRRSSAASRPKARDRRSAPKPRRKAVAGQGARVRRPPPCPRRKATAACGGARAKRRQRAPRRPPSRHVRVPTRPGRSAGPGIR